MGFSLDSGFDKSVTQRENQKGAKPPASRWNGVS
tara:strand:- start:304 stop:405 length:102 start_codon:yes stop_codon:yes gene_type:complete